jgi:photosystem II stability/assembly factor-like uncharacterized protein
MKNRVKIFLFCLFVFLSSPCLSQPYGWFVQSSGTTNNLNGVWLANSNTGYAVGNGGTILKTTNGGTNWVSQSSGTPNHLFGVYFININTGWAAGDVGIILKTTDGGTNWVIQVSNTIYQLHSISFLNSNTGYIDGWYGTIVRTTNGGASWAGQTSGTTNNLLGISFPTAATGYAVGWYGTVVKTVNSGVNWYNVPSGAATTFECTSFIDGYTGYVIGEGGRVQKTTNGGANWVNQSSGTGSWLNGMSSPDLNATVFVGESGAIRKTSNGGINWLAQTSNTSYWLNKVSFSDTLNGWAVGDNGTIIHTTTGGWLLPTAPSLTAPANNATCVSLTVTFDWNDVFPPACNYRIQVSTSNTFSTSVKDTSSLMVSAYTIPGGLLSYNTLYYWRVSATNQVGTGPWSAVRTFTTTRQTPVSPNQVSPPNNSTGQPLTPLIDWDSAAAATTYRLKVSSDSAFGTSIIDTNGLTNTQFQIPSGILQNNTKYYWRVNGANVCVTGPPSSTWNFRTLVTGVPGNNNSEVPKVFKLYTNYPNPFNPVSIIKYDLPEDEFVIIKIFNALGEEIEILENGMKKAGSYSVSFNGLKQASGVYFCQINAGKFADSKKMVLLK